MPVVLAAVLVADPVPAPPDPGEFPAGLCSVERAPQPATKRMPAAATRARDRMDTRVSAALERRNQGAQGVFFFFFFGIAGRTFVGSSGAQGTRVSIGRTASGSKAFSPGLVTVNVDLTTLTA